VVGAIDIVSCWLTLSSCVLYRLTYGWFHTEMLALHLLASNVNILKGILTGRHLGSDKIWLVNSNLQTGVPNWSLILNY
jgi:hypothetical protein